MRFLKYSLLKPFFGSLPFLASIFSSLDWFEFCEEGAGAEDTAVFWSDLGRSCSWVRARPRLQQKEQRWKFYFYVITAVSLFTDIYSVKNPVKAGGKGGGWFVVLLCSENFTMVLLGKLKLIFISSSLYFPFLFFYFSSEIPGLAPLLAKHWGVF